MKRTPGFVALILVVLLLASLVGWYFQPSSVEVARARCIQEGQPADRLLHTGFHRQRSLFRGEQATETFVVKDTTPLLTLRLTLRRPIYFLPWRAEGYDTNPMP